MNLETAEALEPQLTVDESCGQDRAMRILVLGGNQWLGREIVQVALATGHDVTTFTRGVSGPSPAGARALYGDRSQPDGMDVLRGHRWDVTIDVARSPHQVAAAIDVLRAQCPTFVFVSTVSVYADFGTAPITTDTPVVDAVMDQPDDEFDPSRYPNHKVQCEVLVRGAYPDGHLIARPGLIAGPGDTSDRLTYWVERATRPGPILAPGPADTRVRFSDVRDLATWIVAAGTSGVFGTYNTVGPAERLTIGELIDICLDAAGRPRSPIVWVDDGFLLENGVRPYEELPLWVPKVPEYAAFAEVDSGPAERVGYVSRPVGDTVADTLAWTVGREATHREAGLAPAREVELLELWSQRGS